ncbi:MAG: OmpA family protein [Hyphomicrobiales bacterium]|nr:MAG: OmpA family protein [Hyphomicrobiales bacterium]
MTNITNNTVINNNAPTSPVIFQIGVNIVINNPEQERDRMYRPDEDRIYYEELRNGRTRETIVRPNGVRIVTIRNRWGDVLKRSRFSPDGREFILAYYDDERVEDRNSDRDGFFIDPGEKLPPLRLNIPARDYILDVEYADEEEVELFFRQPPVEQVRRIYSVEEVKRSARIRDSVRRVEIGGLTFDSGKATISSTQVGALSKVARAMLAVLDDNPAETFLIEGHTDAVGSDASNLLLSDRRAAVVAQILTDFYKVPPENLVTQGYGERYLKVKTEGSEPINRRATIKRITSLITVADR